ATRRTMAGLPKRTVRSTRHYFVLKVCTSDQQPLPRCYTKSLFYTRIALPSGTLCAPKSRRARPDCSRYNSCTSGVIVYSVLKSGSTQASPTTGLLLGLMLTLAAVLVYSFYTRSQLTGLRKLQSEMVDRNRKDSLQLL